MKPKNSKLISVIFITFFTITSFGVPQLFSHYISRINLPLRENTIDEWNSRVLNHSSIKAANFLDFPQEIIHNFFEQINIYQDWSNRFYSPNEKNHLLLNNMHTPEIRYLGPNNHPIEGFDLICHDDEKFELNFRLDEKILNEWVIRVYAYLDYDPHDTLIGDSEKFEDGSTIKHFQPGVQPTFEDLNPNTNFMGNEFDKILEDHEQWTTSEKDYVAEKNFPGLIDQELLFHVKVLYKKDIYESNEWHNYYFYVNFYISWYWTSNYQQKTLNIRDDDKVPPVISNVNILNTPIFDGHSEINLEISANDNSGISELYVDFLGDRYYDNDNNNHITIPSPSIPGEYTLSITAVDGDLDREGDQLISSVSYNLNIIDDDTTPPQIIIDENELSWNVSILDNDGIIDSEATGNYTLIDQYNTIIDNGIIDQEESIYHISKDLVNPMKPTTITLIIYATNNDYEWEGDEETTEAIRIIVINLEDCFQYVDTQIEDLKNFIKENIQSCFKCFLLYMLNQTQINLRSAYTQVIQDNIICGLNYLESALSYVKMIKSILFCFNQICCCDNVDLEYIICTLIDIRNNIVLLKGNSVDYGRDTDFGYQIGEIEIEVLKLKDFIQDNIAFCDAICLKNLIARTANKVEATLFYLAQDVDYSCLLTYAQNLLELAICEVDYLLNEGKISQSLADILIENISKIQINLELINTLS